MTSIKQKLCKFIFYKNLARKMQFFKSSSYICAYNLGPGLAKTPKIYSKMSNELKIYIFRIVRIDCSLQGSNLEKNILFKIVKKLGCNFIKNDIIYKCLLIIYETHYFKPFSNCYVKLYLVYFRNFNMLFKNYVIEKQICKCYL